MKKFFILIILGLLASCDISYTLLVDKKTKHVISSDCGSIVITGRSSLSDWIKLDFCGDFLVLPNSMKLRDSLDSTLYSGFTFILEDSLIDNYRPFTIQGKKQLRIRISADLPLHWRRHATMNLLPSEFILCNGNPVLTDTISFNYKNTR